MFVKVVQQTHSSEWGGAKGLSKVAPHLNSRIFKNCMLVMVIIDCYKNSVKV